MLLLFVEVTRRPTVGETPTSLDDLFLAEKIRALNRAILVGRFEDHAVAKVQREHLGLVFSQWGNERGG